MLRNVASQKWRVYCWDTTTGLPKTGDAANITAYLTIDDGTPVAITDTNPTEVSSTNEKGYYDFDVTQAESNGAKLTLSPKSSTSNIAVIACPPVVYTRPQYFSLLGIASDGDLTKVNTLDGHTAQTGDSFARIGANGAGLTSLAQASEYTAARAAKLDNLDAAVTTRMATFTLPTNFAALGINASGHVSRVTLTDTTTTNTDMRGTDNALLASSYTAPLDAAGVRSAVGLASANLDTQLGDIPTVAEFNARTLTAASYATAASQTTIAGYIDTEIQTIVTAVGLIADIKGKTDQLTFTTSNRVDATADKTGYKLASDGLDSVSTTAPSGVASNFREMLVALWRRAFKKSTLTSTELKTYADDGSTVLTTQSASDDGTTQTLGDAS